MIEWIKKRLLEHNIKNLSEKKVLTPAEYDMLKNMKRYRKREFGED